jgi:hypothetical protein
VPVAIFNNLESKKHGVALANAAAILAAHGRQRNQQFGLKGKYFINDAKNYQIGHMLASLYPSESRGGAILLTYPKRVTASGNNDTQDPRIQNIAKIAMYWATT